MLSGSMILLLLSVLAGLLLGTIAWGLLRIRWRKSGNDWIEPGDEILLGFLAVAAFSLGAFITYAVLGLRL
jgi:hypothetical protein